MACLQATSCQPPFPPTLLLSLRLLPLSTPHVTVPSLSFSLLFHPQVYLRTSGHHVYPGRNRTPLVNSRDAPLPLDTRRNYPLSPLLLLSSPTHRYIYVYRGIMLILGAPAVLVATIRVKTSEELPLPTCSPNFRPSFSKTFLRSATRSSSSPFSPSCGGRSSKTSFAQRGSARPPPPQPPLPPPPPA